MLTTHLVLDLGVVQVSKIFQTTVTGIAQGPFSAGGPLTLNETLVFGDKICDK